jgi:DNA repair exonuclease SbcCD ATPase subunit
MQRSHYDVPKIEIEMLQKLSQSNAEKDRLRAQLQEQKDYYAKVINDPCPSDEIHCACVPALRTRIAEYEAREELMAKKIWEQLKRISKLEARYQADLLQFLAYDKRVEELERWITEASSAFNLDGSKDTLEDAAGLVRMCHEGRAAIDRVAELEATLKEYANPDNWDNKHIGGMNVWYGTDSDGYELASEALEKKP